MRTRLASVSAFPDGRSTAPASTQVVPSAALRQWATGTLLTQELAVNPAGWTAGHALLAGNLAGPVIHDARVAAICRQHGVKTVWSADRDFSRIAGIKLVNPLLPTGR